MSRSQRDKGRRGQTAASHLLTDRDWHIHELCAGKKSEDMIAESPEGKRYSVEVKNCRLANFPAFITQARTQAAASKLPWMLLVKIAGSSSWVAWRQGEQPVIWREKVCQPPAAIGQ